MDNNIHTCHQCKNAEQVGPQQVCAADSQRRNIMVIAEKAECPLGYHETGLPESAKRSAPPGNGPLAGDIIAAAAKKFGLARVTTWLEKKGINCGCQRRMEKLNRLHARLLAHLKK